MARVAFSQTWRGSLQACAKFIDVPVARRIKATLEPPLWLEVLVDQQMLADDARGRQGKAILVTHALQDEGDLEHGWSASRGLVKTE